MPFAILTILLLFVAAGSLVVTGIYLLVGLPWALISVGLVLFGAGIFLRSGLKPNG